MKRAILIALNSGYVHSSLAVRQLSHWSGIPFVEFNINMPITDVLPRIIDYDILCFSCYIWNIDYVERLMGDVKKIAPNKKIVLGGPSVSFDARAVMERNPQADYVICGEGEEAICELVEKIADGAVPDMSGVLYRDCGVIKGSDEYRMTKKLVCTPYKADIVYFESSRGCPFSCSYCLSGFFKGGVRWYDLEEVKEALTVLSKMDIRVVKFVDRTFNVNEERAAAILKHLLTLDCSTVWHFEIGGDLLTDSLIELLNRGNFQVEIGIQSFNEDTLKEVGRHCDLDMLCDNIKRLTIHKHVDLIAGLPLEDLESFRASFNRAFSLRADMLQLGFLKVLPGSKLNNDKRIIYSKNPPYRVLKTDWLSYDELCELEIVEKAVDIYYNKGRFPLALEYLLTLFDTPYELFLHLAKSLGEDVYAPVGQCRAAENMFESCRGIGDRDILCELLRCDYYFSGAKGNMPAFMREIKYSAKELRKTWGIDKEVQFFVTDVNYRTMEKGRFLVIKATGESIRIGE